MLTRRTFELAVPVGTMQRTMSPAFILRIRTLRRLITDDIVDYFKNMHVCRSVCDTNSVVFWKKYKS